MSSEGATGARVEKVGFGKGFESLSRDVLQDERMSYRARGIWASLISRPDGWRTDSETLARQGKEGREAVRTALKELEQFGLLGRERVQDPETGAWGWVWIVGQDPAAVAHAVAEAVRQRLRVVPDDE